MFPNNSPMLGMSGMSCIHWEMVSSLNTSSMGGVLLLMPCELRQQFELRADGDVAFVPTQLVQPGELPAAGAADNAHALRQVGEVARKCGLGRESCDWLRHDARC